MTYSIIAIFDLCLIRVKTARNATSAICTVMSV